MAIIEYKYGEHPGGFVGFRVVKSIGNDVKQAYYSINHHLYESASKLALQTDEKWMKLASETKLVKNINSKHSQTKEHVIAPGLIANISVEKRKRNGQFKTYFTPSYLVKNPGYGKSCKEFRISKLGFQCSYVHAVREYSGIHKLTKNQELSLIARMPEKTLFTDYLFSKLKARGHKITKSVILQKINLV